jgi:hypothetical protein
VLLISFTKLFHVALANLFLFRCRILGGKRETRFSETNCRNSTEGDRSARVSRAVYLRLSSTTMDCVKKKDVNVEKTYVEQIFP